MIEFNTADGEKLTLLHDGAAVKGAPGGDRASLFIGGHCHALLHGYEDLVKEVEGWIYGPEKPDFSEVNQQTQDAQQAAEPPAPTAEAIAKVVADDRAERELAELNQSTAAKTTKAAEAKAAQAAGADALNATPAATEAPGAGTEQQPA